MSNPYEEAIESLRALDASLVELRRLTGELRRTIEESNPAPLFRRAADSWRDFAGACLVGFVGFGILFALMLFRQCFSR